MECLWCRIPMVLSHKCAKPRTHEIIQLTFRCTNCGRSATRDNVGQTMWLDVNDKPIYASHDK